MKKLGIDLGSASCGWAIRDDNEIINKGVITFSTGMTKGQGGYSSPTQDRREARSKRRLIQARKYRKWELLEILIQNDLVPLKIKALELWSKYQKGIQRKFPETEEFLQWLACDFSYDNGDSYKNPYEIRVKGLDGKLTKHEFGRALYHIVQRRGYKDIGDNNDETKIQKERRDEGFGAAIHEHKFISKALQIEFLDKGKRARNEYPFRDEYEEEFEALCKKQEYDVSKNKKGEYNNDFVKKLRKTIIWQRPLRSQKDKVGKCTLEPNSPRIPVSHPLFEIFRTLQYINTIKTVNENGEKTQIPKEYRDSLLIDEFTRRDSNFKFSIIKTYLDKKFQQKMEYNYLNKRTGKYDSTVSGMPVCKNFIALFGKEIVTDLLKLSDYNITSEIPKTIKGYSIHDLWHLIFNSDDVSFLKDFAENKLKIESTFKEKDGTKIRENEFANLQKVFMQGYSDLSAKAIRKTIPFLQEGKLYNEAVVLAKMPELLGDDWQDKKEAILNAIAETSVLYDYNSDVINIVNGLVNAYKGLNYDELFAYKDTDYLLAESDISDIEKACFNYFGGKTWEIKEDKEAVLNDVKNEYQFFFKDSKRTYRKKVTHTELVATSLKKIGIELNGDLYHHSDRKNIYPKPIFSEKYELNILAVPLIDSIKNPMFNKAMTILRKLINELIIQGEIDEFTEIIVEVARELNDNNKRAAIEKYQNERERNREKYREFIREFNSKENKKININERIDDFELWTEQIFDENNKKIDDKSSNRLSILKETKAIDRYELWTEQKGQCMYTGKMISITQLFSDEIQMEHTIPRSLLPDNTKANQTVCFRKYNNDIKNNQIPFDCPNYANDDSNGSAIKPRLATWQKLKDKYQKDFNDNKRAKGNEDEKKKNERIVRKHYAKMHLDYWTDKLNRFTCDEIKESWARRQLVDTQMVSKYAREFLKTYFKKVNVEKGIITAQFRKIYGFQEEEEIKSRNKHTHHAIDAAVLTLIPNNASRKKALLEKSYEKQERREGQYTTSPYPNFNAQELIRNIEETTLIFNHTKDKIISQTYKKVRKRGEIQKNKDGSIKWMKGDSIRGDLYGQTFLSKIKNVELDENNKPKRDEKGAWEFKKGKDEFTYATKKPIEEVKAKYIKDIIDPNIRTLVGNQKKNNKIFDHQDKEIRHVRVKVKKGRVVKERVNYRSKNEHKNFYYASAGEIPYAVMLEKIIDGKVEERKMIPIAIHEVAKVFKEHRQFNADLYLNFFHNEIKRNYNNWRLLRIGQKVMVLKNDSEFEEVVDINFQRNRLYKITQFKYDGSKIMLSYHLEAQSKKDIDTQIKEIKHSILTNFELEIGLSKLIPNENIENAKDRNEDYQKRKNNFKGRLEIIKNHSNGGSETSKKIEAEISKYKTESSSIEIEGMTPILGFSQKSWNFLYEGEHFEMDVLGNIEVLVEKLT